MKRTYCDVERIGDWIGYGRNTGIYRSQRQVRQWLLEARAHLPVIML